MGSRGIKTVLWGTGSIFLSLGTLGLGLAGGLLGGWALFAGAGASAVSEAVDCPEVTCPEVKCPEVECPECRCDEQEAQAEPAPKPRPSPRVTPPSEPEPEEASSVEARVVIAGDTPTELWFEQGGKNLGAGPLAPGTYDLIVAFGSAPPSIMGQVTVREGQDSITINCSHTYGKCRAVQ